MSRYAVEIGQATARHMSRWRRFLADVFGRIPSEADLARREAVLVLAAQASDRELPHGQWTIADAQRYDHRQVHMAMIAGQLRDCGVASAGQYRGSGCVACDAAGRDTCIMT